MRGPFAAVLRRDLALALRRRSDILNILVFFVVATSLFPLSVNPEPALLRSIGAAVLWVAALLAATLSLGRLFEADLADGTLEQLALSPEPLAVLVLGKLLAHWLLTGLPLALLSPLLAQQFDLGAPATTVLLASLLLGTPVLSMLGGVAAALTLGLRGGAVLGALLVLPLYVPVLIFGTGSVAATQAGLDPAPHLYLLGALGCGALALTPWACAASLRLAVE